MKKMGLVLSVILLIVTCAGCIGFRTARKITGRVVVNGAVPDRIITVSYFVNDGNKIDVTTNSSGYYTIPSTAYNVGDKVKIDVKTTSSYEIGEAISTGLNQWTFTGQFTTTSSAMTVPDLDLYNYGSGITHPVGYESVTFPYSVQFNTYDRIVSNKFYWLYFYDLSNNYIDGTTSFYNSPFLFEGILYNGASLAQDANWYLGVGYKENGFDILTNSFGTIVYFGTGITSLRKHIRSFQESPKPIFK